MPLPHAAHARHCARCSQRLLEPTLHGEVEIDACLACGGLWLERDELDTIILAYDPSFPRGGALMETLGVRQGAARRRCPDCRESLVAYLFDAHGSLEIDVCESCHGIWLDHGQLDHAKVVHLLPGALEAIQRKASWGHWIFQFLSALPVEFNTPPRRVPVVTIALIVANGLAFVGLLAAAEPSRVVDALALLPAEWGTASWALGLVGHSFLHGGWMHLLANLYFLYILGDNLEDVFGPGPFLALFLVCGVLGGLAETALSFERDVPVVGASGAVAGLLGAYAMIFRHAKLTFMLVVFQFKLGALGYVLIWLGMNLIGAVAQQQGIAWFAHLGGFAGGAAIGLLWRERILARRPLIRHVARELGNRGGGAA